MRENKENSFKVSWYIVEEGFGKRTKGFKKYIRRDRNAWLRVQVQVQVQVQVRRKDAV